MSRRVAAGKVGVAVELRARVRRNLASLRRFGLRHYLREKATRVDYLVSRLLRRSGPHDAKWAALAGRFRGKRVFVIGNGPSLNRTPLYLLKNEYKMCFNRFYLFLERLNWAPDFYAVVDNLVLDDLLGEMDQLAGITRYLFLPDIHVRGEKYFRTVREYDNLYWMRHHVSGTGFSTSVPRVYGGGTVIYEGMQILRFLGFEEIALVGVDMNFQRYANVGQVARDPNGIEPKEDEDPNHFDPRYFGKGRRHHQPEDYVIDNIVGRLQFLASHMGELGIRVVNAGYESRVDCFEKRDFLQYVDVAPDEVDALFTECVAAHTRFAGIAEMRASVRALTTAEEATACEGSFSLGVEAGLTVLKRKVLTHLPLGPHAGRLYFIRRDPCLAC